MALTRPLKETMQARAQKDPAFRAALLTETVEALYRGDVQAGQTMLRAMMPGIAKNKLVNQSKN